MYKFLVSSYDKLKSTSTRRLVVQFVEPRTEIRKLILFICNIKSFTFINFKGENALSFKNAWCKTYLKFNKNILIYLYLRNSQLKYP